MTVKVPLFVRKLFWHIAIKLSLLLLHPMTKCGKSWNKIRHPALNNYVAIIPCKCRTLFNCAVRKLSPRSVVVASFKCDLRLALSLKRRHDLESKKCHNYMHHILSHTQLTYQHCDRTSILLEVRFQRFANLYSDLDPLDLLNLMTSSTPAAIVW